MILKRMKSKKEFYLIASFPRYLEELNKVKQRVEELDQNRFKLRCDIDSLCSFIMNT